MELSSTIETSTMDKEADRDFQDKVLEEIAKNDPVSFRASYAWMAAILQCTGSFVRDKKGKIRIFFRSNRLLALEKCFTLLRKTFNIASVSVISQEGHSLLPASLQPVRYEYELQNEDARRVAKELDFPWGEVKQKQEGFILLKDWAVPEKILQDRKSVRGFLSGQFLCIGRVRDPSKEYYLSYEILSALQLKQTKRLLEEEHFFLREDRHGRVKALVTRDSDVIVDVLNLVGAHVCMMDMENARIVKQVRGKVNRTVNCETANIMKTVAASHRQVEDIELLKKSKIWESLPESLRKTALLREQYPESSMQELGQMLDPPIGKSGVNHRLRRISAMAQELRQSE